MPWPVWFVLAPSVLILVAILIVTLRPTAAAPIQVVLGAFADLLHAARDQPHGRGRSRGRKQLP